MIPRFLCIFGLLVSLAGVARADEVAPSLEGPDLRTDAALALAYLRAAQPDAKLTGVYVAFDASESDPLAEVACDDDGDYVVVLSDAMLRLSAEVARVALYDEANHTQKLDAYAAFLAESQTPGKRILPPPAGSFALPLTSPASQPRLLTLLAFVIARELATIRAGAITCAHPTATKEIGDDTWTAAEARAAAARATTLYPGDQAAWDAAAIAELRAANVALDGPINLMQFFARFEGAPAGRFKPTYLTLHPGAKARLAAMGQ